MISHYRESGSFKKTAKKFKISPGQAWYFVKTRAPELIRKQKQTKVIEEIDGKIKAYLIGFANDLAVCQMGYRIRVMLSTSHRAMEEIFRKFFPRYSKAFGVSPTKKIEWTLTAYIPMSYSFLLKKPEDYYWKNVEWAVKEHFYEFLSGLIDAEGSVVIYKKSGLIIYQITISNNNRGMLELVKNKLIAEGYSAHIQRDRNKFRLEICRKQHVVKLLKHLNLMHREKVEKARLIHYIEANKWKHWNEGVLEMLNEIREKFKTINENYRGEAELDFIEKLTKKISTYSALEECECEINEKAFEEIYKMLYGRKLRFDKHTRYIVQFS